MTLDEATGEGEPAMDGEGEGEAPTNGADGDGEPATTGDGDAAGLAGTLVTGGPAVGVGGVAGGVEQAALVRRTSAATMLRRERCSR